MGNLHFEIAADPKDDEKYVIEIEITVKDGQKHTVLASSRKAREIGWCLFRLAHKIEALEFAKTPPAIYTALEEMSHYKNHIKVIGGGGQAAESEPVTLELVDGKG